MITLKGIFKIFIYCLQIGYFGTALYTFYNAKFHKDKNKRRKLKEVFNSHFCVNGLIVSVVMFIGLTILCIWRVGFSFN